MGTGLKGRGKDRGLNMQISAAIKPVNTNVFVREVVPVCKVLLPALM